MSQQTLSSFLTAFFPDEREPIRLRAFAPKKAPNKDSRFTAQKIEVTRHTLATDTTLQAKLKELNNTRGLYFVVNTGGDEDKDITRFNAWFAEDDTRPVEEQNLILDAAPLSPSIRIVTRKSIHAYWLQKGDCIETEWRDMQARLIAHFGGDEKIKNPSRVMRLPFFNHVHYEKETGALSYKRVELVEFALERRYTLAEMQAAFAPVSEPESQPGAPVHAASQGASEFASWDDIHAEAARRIRLSSKARTDRKGWTHAPGICHGSTDGKALYVSPDGAYGCLNRCTTATIRTVHGLPERPNTIEPERPLNSNIKPDEAPLQIVQMADVASEIVRWLWHPYIAFGKLTLLEGDPGLGKSWLTCAMAAGVSCGRGLPGAGIYEAGNVLMLSAEDGLADTLRPRLDAVRADVSRVFALAEPLTFDIAGLVKLEAAIIEYNPLLVIIDPLFAFTGAKADIHRANECRAISAPLAAIAERQGCAIVALRHLGKSRGGGHALNAGIGSIDFTAAARSVLLVGADPDEPNKRAIVQTKNNLAPHGPAVGFKLENGQFYWTGESSLTAGRILSIASEDERSTVEEAAYFLRNTLEDGPVPTKEVKREARKAGISDATLRRAKDRLGVRAGKRGGHFGSNEQCWVWFLPRPEDAQESAEGAQEKEIEHLQANSTNKNSYSSNLAEDAQLSDFEHLQERGLPGDIVIPPEMPDEEYKRQFEEFRR
jgi:hypothetical protein